MRTALPATIDPARFEEWCRAFRIRADLVAVRDAGAIVGYEAVSENADDELAIALKWTIEANAAPIVKRPMPPLQPIIRFDDPAS